MSYEDRHRHCGPACVVTGDNECPPPALIFTVWVDDVAVDQINVSWDDDVTAVALRQAAIVVDAVDRGCDAYVVVDDVDHDIPRLIIGRRN